MGDPQVVDSSTLCPLGEIIRAQTSPARFRVKGLGLSVILP